MACNTNAQVLMSVRRQRNKHQLPAKHGRNVQVDMFAEQENIVKLLDRYTEQQAAVNVFIWDKINNNLAVCTGMTHISA